MANTTYPYYIPVWVSGGILHKVSGRTKYASVQDAIGALQNHFRRARIISNSDKPCKGQFAILEYKETYSSCIVVLINNETTVYSALE